MLFRRHSWLVRAWRAPAACARCSPPSHYSCRSYPVGSLQYFYRNTVQVYSTVLVYLTHGRVVRVYLELLALLSYLYQYIIASRLPSSVLLLTYTNVVDTSTVLQLVT